MTTVDDLSIQLYSMRFHGDLSRQLEALATIGFKRVETIGSHLVDAAGTRSLLDAHGLAAPTGHVGLPDLRSRLAWVADQARVIGIDQLYMPAVPMEDRDQPADRWRALGNELALTAEQLAGHGVALGYHNHDWELRAFADGRTPLELMLEAAAGSRLGWQADVAWLARGGVDPAAWLERYRQLLTSVHVKDIAPAGQHLDEDGWCDIGQGILDWRALWQRSTELGARHMVLEHDKPKDAVAFARNSRAYLRDLPI